MIVAEVEAYLERKWHRLLSWQEFESRAEDLRLAALKGELIFPKNEESAKLQVAPRVRLLRGQAMRQNL